MGRAIVRDPQVFLFDEPLSNLDAKLRVQMRTEIKELHQRLKTTTVYVTHDQIEAMTMADKIVVMHDGIVEQMGAPLELYDRPANLFVAGFIGSPSMNFVQRQDPRRHAAYRGDRGRRALPARRRARRFRRPPGRLRHAPRAHPSRPRTASPAEVVVVEPTGSETQVVARVGGQDLVCVFRERITARPGETILIAPDPNADPLFDAEIGQAPRPDFAAPRGRSPARPVSRRRHGLDASADFQQATGKETDNVQHGSS